jgi:voltage-gated potassium channel Kch
MEMRYGAYQPLLGYVSFRRGRPLIEPRSWLPEVVSKIEWTTDAVPIGWRGWAMTTATTVGYGDMYPRTAAGRGVGVVLMLLGITLFGVLTANLAAFFVEDQENEVVAEVRALRQQVEELTRRLNARAEE